MRKSLSHVPPSWIDSERETYFLSINCQLRGPNQLALPDIAGKVFETVTHRHQSQIWWCDLMLLMPDHLHALISFPRHSLSFQQRVENWKEWTAKSVLIQWQRGFFEHRLRCDESRNVKARYILENPIRASLVEEERDWRYVWFAHGPRPYGWPVKR